MGCPGVIEGAQKEIRRCHICLFNKLKSLGSDLLGGIV